MRIRWPWMRKRRVPPDPYTIRADKFVADIWADLHKWDVQCPACIKAGFVREVIRIPTRSPGSGKAPSAHRLDDTLSSPRLRDSSTL